MLLFGESHQRRAELQEYLLRSKNRLLSRMIHSTELEIYRNQLHLWHDPVSIQDISSKITKNNDGELWSSKGTASQEKKSTGVRSLLNLKLDRESYSLLRSPNLTQQLSSKQTNSCQSQSKPLLKSSSKCDTNSNDDPQSLERALYDFTRRKIHKCVYCTLLVCG